MDKLSLRKKSCFARGPARMEGNVGLRISRWNYCKEGFSAVRRVKFVGGWWGVI